MVFFLWQPELTDKHNLEAGEKKSNQWSEWPGVDMREEKKQESGVLETVKKAVQEG